MKRREKEQKREGHRWRKRDGNNERKSVRDRFMCGNC